MGDDSLDGGGVLIEIKSWREFKFIQCSNNIDINLE